MGRLWLAALVAGQAAAAPIPRRPSGKLVVSELRQRYGLEVSTAGAPFPVETRHGRIEGADAEPTDVESFLRILGPEWGAYPPALIRRTGLGSGRCRRTPLPPNELRSGAVGSDAF